MIINTKFDVGQKALYRSKSGTDKVGTIEKLFINYWGGKKMYIGYFIKGVLKEFKEPELKQVKDERSDS